MGAHISGELFAKRTVDAKPLPAKAKMFFSSRSISKTVCPSKKELTCDKCDTYATCLSCSSGSMKMVFIPNDSKTSVAIDNDCGEDFSFSQMIFVLSLNKPENAASGPEFSVPAIG